MTPAQRILASLSAGNRSYAQLRRIEPNNVDGALKVLLAARRITLTVANGGPALYTLWPKPKDEPEEKIVLERGPCQTCGKTVKRGWQKFCSMACRVVARSPCKRCGKRVRLPSHKFCSVACQVAARIKERPDCLRCGRKIKRRGARFCSRFCANRSKR